MEIVKISSFLEVHLKIGKLLQCAKTLNLSKLDGIIEYLPEELYIRVKACTPIKEIEEKLKKIINN